MTRFFTFLQEYRIGILVFFLSLGGIALLVQWIAWIFGRGRFGIIAPPAGGRAQLRYLFAELTTKIINEFRHLLALIIVVIFAGALAYSLWKAGVTPTGPDMPSVIDNMKEALQAVTATLGGLVGSILGYYFGESSVAKTTETRTIPSPAPDQEPIQETPAPV
jgi:drug/metabolite transporter (DMT)-like permease